MKSTALNPSLTTLSRRGLLIAGASAAGLAACGTDEPNDQVGDDADDEPSVPTTPDTDAVTETTFTSWSMNEESTQQPLGALLDGWTAESGVDVETPSFPYNDYLAQVLLQISGGQAAGAGQTDISWLATLAATGALADLGGSAARFDYTAAALAATQVDGVQFGLPWTIAAIGMIYNADLLTQAGVGAPGTIEEFEQVLEALKELDVIPYAAMTDLAQLKDIIPWMWQFGSAVYDGTGLTLGDEGSVAAVAWYKDLLDRGLIAADVDRFDARSLFADARVGFYEDAIVAPNIIAASASDPAVVDAMTPIGRPVRDAGDISAALAWGHAVVVFTGDGQQAAADLAEHLTGNSQVALEYFNTAQVTPTTETALGASEVAANAWISEFSNLITMGARSNPFWVFPEFGQIEDRLGTHVQRALIGEASAQQAMNDAKADIEDLMN